MKRIPITLVIRTEIEVPDNTSNEPDLRSRCIDDIVATLAKELVAHNESVGRFRCKYCYSAVVIAGHHPCEKYPKIVAFT